MPTDKRARQKAARAAKRAEELRLAKRARNIRLLRNLAIVAAVVFGGALLISLLGGNGDDEASPTTTLSTTTTTIDPLLAPTATSNELFRAQGTACGATVPPEPAELTYTEPEDQELGPADTVTATITTSCGDIVVELDPEAAPETVNSFVFLAREGYFDGTASHRILPDFMMQAGDPTATGTGGPGYTVPDELPELPAEIQDQIDQLQTQFDAGEVEAQDFFDQVQELYRSSGIYAEGVVAMANSGQPDSGGSQFFIVLADAALPPDFTVFGRVVEGEETLVAIRQIERAFNLSQEEARPLASLYLETVEITVS